MIFFLIKTQINRILFFSQSNSIHFHHTDTQISHKFQGTSMQNSNQTQRTGMQNPLQIQTTSIQNSHKIQGTSIQNSHKTQGTGMQSMPPSRPHTKKDTDDKKIIVCVNKLLLACPEKGSARGKNGLRNSESFPPRKFPPGNNSRISPAVSQRYVCIHTLKRNAFNH